MNASPDTRTPVPPLPLALAWSGMIPFAAGAAALWWLPFEHLAGVARALVLYGAVIATFMGAIHFGLGIAAERGAHVDGAGLGLSVLPALAVWFAMLGLPEPTVLVVSAVVFALIFALDRRAANLGLAPAWYPRMRLPLTVTVIVLLFASAGALAVRG